MSLLRVPRHGPHSYTRRGHGILQSYNLQRFHNRLPYELRGTLLGQRAWSAPGPQSISGHPELLQITLRNKTTCNFAKDYATLQTTWAREKTPSDHWSRAMSSPWAVQSPPSLTKQTLQDTTQVNLSKQENYITKHYKLAQQIAFYEQKTSPRLIRSLGKGMSFDGVTMA